jgi:hypothetical protein
MKSKFKLFSAIVLCASALIASAVAQTFGQQNSGSSTSQGGFGIGGGQSSARPAPAGADLNSMPPVNKDFGAKSFFSQVVPYFGGNRNEWQVHQEEAAIAPLVKQLKDAKSDSEIDKIKGQLDDALEKSFAMRQKRHTEEIEDLEAKVKKLKELVAKRQEKRHEIIANRRDQILRDAQGLGW